MGTATQSAVTRDLFTEQHLGVPFYRLTRPLEAAAAIEALEGSGDFLVDAKVPTSETRVVDLLTELGFRVVDVGIQLDAPAELMRGGRARSEVRIRDACPADREAVERCATENLTTSRFHLDPAIDPVRASALKGAWAGNFFEGLRGERMLIVERGGRVGGFLQVLERATHGTIDLIALDPDLRGTGAVDGLIGSWLTTSAELAEVLVGTQVSNVRSLRAYGRLGFRVRNSYYVLHLHGGSAGGGGR